jgi:hypothetical protein
MHEQTADHEHVDDVKQVRLLPRLYLEQIIDALCLVRSDPVNARVEDLYRLLPPIDAFENLALDAAETLRVTLRPACVSRMH